MKEFKNWDFKNEIKYEDQLKSKTIKFVFEFEPPNDNFSFEFLEGKGSFVAKDGYIKHTHKLNDELFAVYDRIEAINIKNNLEKKVQQILKDNNFTLLDEYEHCFHFEIVKIDKPTHMFTKEEIKKEMENADDRYENQLVIDENGYARVIRTSIENGMSFPVRHESWNAGNNYVGKYSKLSTLDQNYISSLQGWLRYLQNGKKVFVDYVGENTNEEQLVSEINKYY